MKLIDGLISVFVNSEFTDIELIDATSSITFARIRLTPEQLSQALSRLSHTKCAIEVHNTDKLNKKLQVSEVIFEVPDNSYNYVRDNADEIYRLACEACKDGFIPDNYFGSQRSFFTKDGKPHARATTRRWIDNTLNS